MDPQVLLYKLCLLWILKACSRFFPTALCSGSGGNHVIPMADAVLLRKPHEGRGQSHLYL